MSFTPEWLSLRAPADDRARAPDILAAAAEWLGAKTAPLVVDLGAGSGATWRALAPLAPHARWRLVDHDAALLGLAARQAPGAEARLADLADPAALAEALSGADLVTASAFFDLVSETWLEMFFDASPPEAALYAALTYDGRETWAPAGDDDAAVRAAVARHMRGDKGFGPALGGDACAVMTRALARRGRAARTADSAWVLEPPRDAALAQELAHGHAGAAAELGADPGAFAATPRVRVEIGHEDVFAKPHSTGRV